MFSRFVRPLFLACAGIAIAAGGAHAGPPWISVEYPVNPHHADTRGAFLVLHTYHHGDHRAHPVTGRAEGLVDGRRRSVPVRIVPLEGAGRYAVRWDAPEDGSWVLVLDLDLGRNDGASALVGTRRGELASVRVPTTRQEGWVVPRRATAADIEAALRTQVAGDAAPTRTLAGLAAPLALALLAGVVLRRRRFAAVTS